MADALLPTYEKDVVAWLAQHAPPTIATGQLSEYLHSVIPRSVFMKNLPAATSLLDLGAGDGALNVYREWPSFSRRDLKMYAVSLAKGESFDKYEAYELGNFEEVLPDFGGRLFGAVLCAHFIEHMKDPARCIHWIASRLEPGGRLYLEWPHPMSKSMPTLETFRHAVGVDVMTTNFFDDHTHVEAWPMATIVECIENSGMYVETSGRIVLPFAAEELRNAGLVERSAYLLTMAVWLRVGWAQFLVATKL